MLKYTAYETVAVSHPIQVKWSKAKTEWMENRKEKTRFCSNPDVSRQDSIGPFVRDDYYRMGSLLNINTSFIDVRTVCIQVFLQLGAISVLLEI